MKILSIDPVLTFTLVIFQLKTTTTVACSRNFQEDRIWLNGKEEDINQPRLQSCLRESTVLFNLHMKYTQFVQRSLFSCKMIHPVLFLLLFSHISPKVSAEKTE